VRARRARYQQDSALSDYRVIARQRWTGGIGLAAMAGVGGVGRPRLAARFESIARIYWHHELGAYADLIAGRGAAPIVGEIEATPADDEIVLVIPFAPGQEQLWPMSELREALPGRAEWIAHPLAAGSDSLYRFSLGGPLDITLPSGRRIRLRELHVRPRRPDPQLIVGSLWLDISSGALVRAAYRPSVALDLWPLMEPNFDGDERETIEKLGPFRGNVEEIVIEHGLYAERFWLPRTRIAHAEGTAKGARVTISIEQTFDYEHVQALAPGVAQAPQSRSQLDPDRPRRWDDTYYRYEDARGGWDTRRGPCRSGDDAINSATPLDSLASMHTELASRGVNGQRLRVRMPCNRSSLVTSPQLPASIYDPSDALFTDTDLNRLRTEVAGALAMEDQADFEPQRATWRYGLAEGLLRFNRIEGLSAGARVESQLGRGYSIEAMARLGHADLEPNGELMLRRSNGRGAWRAGVFRRLDVANDWGNPLALPASLGALLLGRDDGIFHRAIGAEIGSMHRRISGGPTFSWRVFGERHHIAVPENTFSFARVMSGSDFAANIPALEGDFVGGAAVMAFATGVDPRGTQFSGSLRGEVADGPVDYGRGLVELRLGRGLGERTVAAISAAAGGSRGVLPPQRGFYLGGPQTIHAHEMGSVSGDAFWFARAELTRGTPIIRPTLFADAGWAGDRSQFRNSRAEVAAVGIGAAALDGLVRMDVSRSVRGGQRWGFDLFIDLR
jgi:hypothetical protein